MLELLDSESLLLEWWFRIKKEKQNKKKAFKQFIMGQYIDKSNALIRWILVLANFVILVSLDWHTYDILNFCFFKFIFTF